MKRAGLLGGMSWESTITYYRIINEYVAENAGSCTCADMVIRSFNLAEIDYFQSRGEWEKVSAVLSGGAAELEKIGADFILMASNTVHRVYEDVQASVKVPVLHIADPAVEAVTAAGMSTAGLLGTRYTMEGDFLKEKLNEAGIGVVVPSPEKIGRIHEVIFNEPCMGEPRPEIREMFREVIDEMKLQGAQCIILGCTELGLMIKEEDSCLPIFDTAVLHAQKAAEEILK
ncbi:MAG: amino acid racemase [Firmicutes bacterium]|nr:amino acid racemase [Bacillota bacterium]